MEPGGDGNPSPDVWYILYSERRSSAGGQAATRSFRRSTGTSDEGLARAALQHFIAARARPKLAHTINDLLNRYLEALEAKHKKRERHKTQIGKNRSLVRPVRAFFGELSPDEVTPKLIEEYIAQREKEPRRRGHRGGDGNVAERDGLVSDRTISLELASLRAALRRGVKQKEIPESAMPAISLPRPTPKARRRALKRTEFKTFMAEVFSQNTPEHLRAFVVLGILTGQRSKALKALKWTHVDFDEGMIYFTLTDPDAADNKRIADTPMTPHMAQLMSELKEVALSDYVIEWNGAGVHSLKTAWRKLLARTGLDDVRIHDLRRSAATIALNAGADVSKIALLLNDDERTVRRSYAHASPALLLGVVEVIENEVAAARPALDVGGA